MRQPLAFKKKLCNDYGAIYDTKYLYFYTDETKVPSSDTKLHLEDIYKLLRAKYQDKVQISIPNDDNENFVNYLGNNNNLSEKFHQADFDAFVTGCTFLYLREEYGSEKIEKNVFHFNLIASIYKGMNMLDEDKLKYENVRLLTFYNLLQTIAYTIKFKNGNGSYEDLCKILGEKIIQKIKKVYYLEKEESAVVFIEKGLDLENEIKHCIDKLDILSLNNIKGKNNNKNSLNLFI